jgi:UDP-N-acetylglucosamine 2-epimerase (non-hydrolysing)
MRQVTERPEGLWAGTVKLVGTTRTIILTEVKNLLEDPGHYQALVQANPPYSDGCAPRRIVEILAQQLRAI